jgi:plasmid stabilization system protein ParE
MYPADKYRKNNDGSFSANELHHYRIAYRFTEKEIIIVRVRHTSMEPKQY